MLCAARGFGPARQLDTQSIIVATMRMIPVAINR
jgi:hypothetical protein